MIWWKEQRTRQWRQQCCTKLPATRAGKVLLTSTGSMWEQRWNKPRTGHSMQILLPGKLHGFGKCFLFKSEQEFDERLELQIHFQWHSSGHSPTGKPRLQLLLHLIWGQTWDLEARAPTTGLLSGFSVINFSLFPLPFNGDYTKKNHHIHPLFFNSFHLVPTWHKIISLVWSSRVRCICISSSLVSLSPTPEVLVLFEKPFPDIASAALTIFSRKYPFQQIDILQ